MAREKQVEQNKKQSTTANTSSTSSNRSTESTASTPSSASSPVSERERNIETGREQGRDRSMATRPYSSAVHSQSSSPFSLMRRMAEDMDNLFEHFGLGRGALTLPSAFGGLSDDLWSTPALRQPAWTPQVEVIQRGDKIVVHADLPGLKKEDISIDINDGVLSISGERKDDREESRDGFYRSERSYGQFYRAIPLPDGANPDSVDAKFNDGVLEITLDAPRLEQKKAKRIQIR